MKFGLMYDFRNPEPWRRPFPELYRATLDQIVRVDDLGYDNVWLTEHHFVDDGYNPSVLTTAAAIAARTSRVRIGTFVLLMPFHDPVRVAEDCAAVDIWSNGRFDFGVGQGYRAEEFAALCIPREERSARLAEGIDLIKRLWTEERVSFAGRFNQVEGLTLAPKPVQRPHPPIWIGARTEKAVGRAARLGYHLLGTVGPDPAVPYVKALRENGRDPADYSIAQLRAVYVAKSAAQAWDEAGEHLHYMMCNYASWLGEAMDAPGDERAWPIRSARDLRESPLGASLMIGTPEDCVAKIEAFRQQYACTHLIMATQLAGLDPRKATRSIELFAREVMPHFRASEQHAAAAGS
ncbi:MAG: LLM class flavin-dependent oxidoreductase [Candidatus Binataceae bacterium]|jgi:alkanesulfonate monooxygenase SsuD/methylene tetrahydromethanopterin reductase-like flavin-dependent oxidoreductase (luciferase family)